MESQEIQEIVPEIDNKEFDENKIESIKIDYNYLDKIYDLIFIRTKSFIIFKCKEKNISIIKREENEGYNEMNNDYFIKISNIKFYLGKYSFSDLKKIDNIFIYFNKKEINNSDEIINKIYLHIKSLIDNKKLIIEINKKSMIFTFEFNLNYEKIPIKLILNEKNLGKKELIEFFSDDFNENIKQINNLKKENEELKKKIEDLKQKKKKIKKNKKFILNNNENNLNEIKKNDLKNNEINIDEKESLAMLFVHVFLDLLMKLLILREIMKDYKSSKYFEYSIFFSLKFLLTNFFCGLLTFINKSIFTVKKGDFICYINTSNSSSFFY